MSYVIETLICKKCGFTCDSDTAIKTVSGKHLKASCPNCHSYIKFLKQNNGESMNANFNLFKNNKKTSSNSPDMRGNGKDDQGNELDIAAWTKLDKNGNRYLSVKVSPARGMTSEPQPNKDMPS
jgi:hypothetical protein